MAHKKRLLKWTHLNCILDVFKDIISWVFFVVRKVRKISLYRTCMVALLCKHYVVNVMLWIVPSVIVLMHTLPLCDDNSRLIDWLIDNLCYTYIVGSNICIFFVLKWIHSCWKMSCFTWNWILGFQRWIFTEKFSVLHSDHIIHSLCSSAACFNNMGWLFSETNWSVFPWNVLLRINISPNSIYTLSALSHSHGLLFTCVQDFAEGKVCCTAAHLTDSTGMDQNFFRRSSEIVSAFLFHNSNSCQRREPEG